MNKYHLQRLAEERADQRSFHIASETHVRIQFMRLDQNQTLGPLRYEGDIVLTGLEGTVEIAGQQLNALEQCLVAEGTELQVVARTSTATIQLIWCPPFAEVSPPLAHGS